jgi:hypothetical protein
MVVRRGVTIPKQATVVVAPSASLTTAQKSMNVVDTAGQPMYTPASIRPP